MNTIAVVLTALISVAAPNNPASYDGFNNAVWGSSPEEVRQAVGASAWRTDSIGSTEFPRSLGVTAFHAPTTIAGYQAMVRYYFYNNKLFQATVRFNFDDLADVDFNYNVYKSVSEYYTTIHDRTITFVDDCFDLLVKRYGTQKPYFQGLDPRRMFSVLDNYFPRELEPAVPSL